MQAVSYTELRRKLKSFMDNVFNNKEALIITRKNNENVVMISLEEYNSLMETNYLLATKANDERLESSLRKARGGNVFERDLIEE